VIILPIDGTYYEWQQGDGLKGVASFFGVDPQDIINYAGNHLSPENIGDPAVPNIEPGTFLIVPNGQREFVSWSAPLGVTRDNPAYARVLGPAGGRVRSKPSLADQHYISGFDYSPKAITGIDIAGSGEGVYATRRRRGGVLAGTTTATT
jgi:hypothetical protein